MGPFQRSLVAVIVLVLFSGTFAISEEDATIAPGNVPTPAQDTDVAAYQAFYHLNQRLQRDEQHSVVESINTVKNHPVHEQARFYVRDTRSYELGSLDVVGPWYVDCYGNKKMQLVLRPSANGRENRVAGICVAPRDYSDFIINDGTTDCRNHMWEEAGDLNVWATDIEDLFREADNMAISSHELGSSNNNWIDDLWGTDIYSSQVHKATSRTIYRVCARAPKHQGPLKLHIGLVTNSR